LEGGIDAVWSGMRSRQRTKLRSHLRLKSTGAVRIELFSPDNSNHVYNLFSATYLRKHRTLPPPKEVLTRLHLLDLENSEVIHIGAFEGSSKRPSAVLIMLLDQTQLLYAWGTSGSDSGPEMSTLLIHEAINVGLQRGARVLNLGVSPLSHIGLRQFKRGWGGLELPIYDYFWNMRAAIIDPHDDFRIWKPMISKLPPWSAPGLSRLAVRYFV